MELILNLFLPITSVIYYFVRLTCRENIAKMNIDPCIYLLCLWV